MASRKWPWNIPGSMIPTSERTEAVVHEILSVVDRIESRLTDSPPVVEVTPELSDALDKAVAALWDSQHLEWVEAGDVIFAMLGEIGGNDGE